MKATHPRFTGWGPWLPRDPNSALDSGCHERRVFYLRGSMHRTAYRNSPFASRKLALSAVVRELHKDAQALADFLKPRPSRKAGAAGTGGAAKRRSLRRNGARRGCHS